MKGEFSADLEAAVKENLETYTDVKPAALTGALKDQLAKYLGAAQ